MNAKIQSLARHDSKESGWAVFQPETGPAFVGNLHHGFSWTCAHCGAVLVNNVHERQILDVLFRCPKCNSLSESPNRLPGEPVPAMTTLVPPGSYRLSAAVDLADKPVLVAGQSALLAYSKETGARHGAPHQILASGGPSELTAASIRSLARDAKALLSVRYARLAAADRRGISSSTPPSRRHRLMELIELAEESAQRLESNGESVTINLDGDGLAELVATVSVFDRWQHHPAYPRLVDSLQNQDEVQHAVMTLLIASYLVDAGNGASVVDDDGVRGRIPDIWVVPTLTERLELEVKTPLRLRAPATMPSSREVARIVEHQLDKAASSKRGQLNPDHSGIVAIGAFHLPKGGLDLLEAAASLVLDRQRERKRHVAAILLCELTWMTTTEVDAATGTQKIAFAPIMEHRLVYHPGYSGSLKIAEVTPWSSWPEK